MTGFGENAKQNTRVSNEFFVSIPRKLHEKTNSDWLKMRTLTYYPIREFFYMKSFFVQITQNHKKLIRNPLIGVFSMFPAFSTGKFFSENRAQSHFEHCHILHLVPKSEKTGKNLEPIPRKAGKIRTNGQRLIYRTSSR